MEYTEKELEQEVWRDIYGYEGMYQVSDLGRVRSKHSGEWKMMMASKVSTGYLGVSLSKGNKVKKSYIHRLVAQSFIPNDDESKNQVNHKDENKENNRVDNLEWCDNRYNNTYNGLHHRRMENYHRSNYKRNAIRYLYDPNLSIPKNLEIFKVNGIECSSVTICRLRKELGLTKKYNRNQ